MKFWYPLIAAAVFSAGCASEIPPPYNVTADTGGGTVFLSWDCQPCDSFVVERSQDGPYAYRAVAKVEGDRKDYRDFDVDLGDTYYYRVAAWYGDVGRMSSYSSEVGIEVK